MIGHALQIVSALVRRGDSLLMVLQGAPGEEPTWSIPSGRVEPGELLTDALARELREETGLEAARDPKLAFSAQFRDGDHEYVVWTFEVVVEAGDASTSDPDGLVIEAAFVPLGEALRRLELLDWQALTVRYLRGRLVPGSLAVLRRGARGDLTSVASIEPAVTGR